MFDHFLMESLKVRLQMAELATQPNNRSLLTFSIQKYRNVLDMVDVHLNMFRLYDYILLTFNVAGQFGQYRSPSGMDPW